MRVFTGLAPESLASSRERPFSPFQEPRLELEVWELKKQGWVRTEATWTIRESRPPMSPPYGLSLAAPDNFMRAGPLPTQQAAPPRHHKLACVQLAACCSSQPRLVSILCSFPASLGIFSVGRSYTFLFVFLFKIFFSFLCKDCMEVFKRGEGNRNITGCNTQIFDKVLYLFFLNRQPAFSGLLTS